MTGSTPDTSTMTDAVDDVALEDVRTTSRNDGETASRGTRENKPDKALRFLAHGRLRVTPSAERDLVQAECAGDSGKVYMSSASSTGAGCAPAPLGLTAAHLMALWRVALAYDRLPL